MIPILPAFGISDLVKVGDYPRDIDMDPILGKIYTVNFDSGTISVIDSKTMKLTDEIILKNSHPVKIKVDPLHQKLYVSDKISGDLTVIDTMTHEIINVVDVGSSLWDMALHKNSGKLYISDIAEKKIIIFEPVSFDIIGKIKMQSTPWDMTLDQRTGILYVVDGTNYSVQAIETENNFNSSVISVDIKPWTISINESGQVMYLSSWDSSKILAVDIITQQKTSEIQVLPGISNIATNQLSGTTLVTNESTNEVYVINKNSVLTNVISVQNAPHSITINPVSNNAYVASPLGNSVFSITYMSENQIIQQYNDIIDKNEEYSDLLSETVRGIIETPQRNDVDESLISGLLKNIGITGDFDGNEIARILIDDYDKKIQDQPKSVAVPDWTYKIAQNFDSEFDANKSPKQIDCFDKDIKIDWKDFDAFGIWLKILPVCAFS